MKKMNTDLNNILKNRLSKNNEETSITFHNEMRILYVEGLSDFMFKEKKQLEKQQNETKKKERNKDEEKICKIKRPSND